MNAAAINFKKCTNCGQSWLNRDAFLNDAEVKIIGYQSNLSHLEEGFFLFNHLAANCQTTISIKVGRFRDLWQGVVHPVSAFDTDECEHQCCNVSDLNPCKIKCANVHVREILHVIKNWPKAIS